MSRITRRHLCIVSLSGIGSVHSSLSAQGIPSPLREPDPDDWISRWKAQAKINKALEGPLDLRRFKDPFYALLNEIGWKPESSGTGLKAFRVPKGFVTDFASVPRPFWSIFPPDGKYAYAAVLHDWLYWTQDQSKEAADMIFRSAMDDLTITDSQAKVLYQAVNIFGGSAWRKNAELKKAGEKRVLSSLPDKPEIMWMEWKTKQGVFK